MAIEPFQFVPRSYGIAFQSKSRKPQVFMLLKIVLKHIFLKDIFVLIDSLSFLPDSTVLNFTFKFLLCIDCKVP